VHISDLFHRFLDSFCLFYFFPQKKLPFIIYFYKFFLAFFPFLISISLTQKTKSVAVKGGGHRECYLDSSAENLDSLVGADVRRRRRRLVNHTAPPSAAEE
jgi:hypothetical protein